MYIFEKLTQRCLTVHSGKCWLSAVSQCAVWWSVCGGCNAALKLSSQYRLPNRDYHNIVCGSQAVDCLSSNVFSHDMKITKTQTTEYYIFICKYKSAEGQWRL